MLKEPREYAEGLAMACWEVHEIPKIIEGMREMRFVKDQYICDVLAEFVKIKEGV